MERRHKAYASRYIKIKKFSIDTRGNEVFKLYPQCREYKFVFDNSNKIKSAIVKFSKVEDAIKMCTESNNIFKSNILHFEFLKINGIEKEVIINMSYLLNYFLLILAKLKQ